MKKLQIETGEMGKLFKAMPLSHIVKEIPFTVTDLAKAGITIPQLIEAIKARYLLETLQLFNGNWTQSAQMHNVNRATFMNWASEFKRYGIQITTQKIQDALAADLNIKKIAQEIDRDIDEGKAGYLISDANENQAGA